MLNLLNVPVALPNDVVPLQLRSGVTLATAIVKGKQRPSGKRCKYGKDRGIGWELFFNPDNKQYTVIWDCPVQCFKEFTLRRVIVVLSEWTGIKFQLGTISNRI